MTCPFTPKEQKRKQGERDREIDKKNQEIDRLCDEKVNRQSRQAQDTGEQKKRQANTSISPFVGAVTCQSLWLPLAACLSLYFIWYSAFLYEKKEEEKEQKRNEIKKSEERVEREMRSEIHSVGLRSCDCRALLPFFFLKGLSPDINKREAVETDKNENRRQIHKGRESHEKEKESKAALKILPLTGLFEWLFFILSFLSFSLSLAPCPFHITLFRCLAVSPSARLSRACVKAGRMKSTTSCALNPVAGWRDASVAREAAQRHRIIQRW